MKTTINSRNHGEVTFFTTGTDEKSGYVWVDLNGKTGTLGNQICDGGYMTGSTKSYRGTLEGFDKFCRNWWSAYLCNQRGL